MDFSNDLPELKKAEVDHVVELYKSIYQSAVRIVSAVVLKHPTESSNIILSEWSQRNLERGSSFRILRTMLSDISLKSCVEINTVDISNWSLNAMSKSEKLKAVIHTTSPDGQKSNMKYYLEIWNQEKSLMVFDLASLEYHGPVYTDEMFGTLNWTEQEDKVVYIAEKNPPKTAPFYQQKAKPDDSSTDKKEPLVGEQYVYEDDWGEQMSPKRQSVIAVCDIPKKSISILDGLPEYICPGNVIWDPSGEGVVGVGFYHDPKRLGIVFCTNRPCCIFYLTLDGKHSILSDKEMSVMSPRFSPDGKYLIWLQHPRGGPHAAAKALVKCVWSSKRVTTVVDIIDKVTVTKNGKEFYGIFTAVFPRRCWTADSRYVLFSTVQKYRINSYIVDINDGSIWDIGSADENESTSILDISEDDFVIGDKSSFKQPHGLASLHVPSVLYASDLVEPCWNSLSKPTHLNDTNIISQFPVYDVKTRKDRCFATYYGPERDEHRSVPVLVYPHGGPHAITPSAFNPAFHFFTCAGFGILIVHYRGSLGCGQNYVNALLGHIGALDVDDCFATLKNALEKFPWLDGDNVVLYGGSHGGFLVTHLSSQYPDAFKATVAMNPVTNIPAMVFTTDIPDWAVVECGFPYDGIATVMENSELWKKMRDVSPVKNVRNVKTPTLLLLGKKDLRVSPYQGLSYGNMLREYKVPTKILYYNDNHSLCSVPVEMDRLINAVIWFKRCLNASRTRE